MSYVEIQEEKHVAFVTLNRPDIRNAFDPKMIELLTKVFSGLESRQDLLAVVLQGQGKVFCAGADLNWMREMVNYTVEQNRQDSQKLFAMFETISRCSLPVIGLVQGAAFGGALGLVACCDYVIADPSVQFCFSETKLGIVPAVISPFILRKTATAKISHLMMSATVFNSTRALDLGLIHEIAPSSEFKNILDPVLSQYRECGREAVRETKRLVVSLPTLSWAECRERTTQVIAERRVSAEGQEGLKSFLEKRSPNWRVRS